MTDFQVNYEPVYMGQPPVTFGRGKVLRFRFENGYGASVVTHDFSQGGMDEWELAVIRFEGDNPKEDGDFELVYDTLIHEEHEDVFGYLSWDQVEVFLGLIKELR